MDTNKIKIKIKDFQKLYIKIILSSSVYTELAKYVRTPL